jgi:predicted ATPase
MKITRYFVSGYKNLKDCEISPDGFHVITGCNGTGKSNFLEVLAFIKFLLSGSEDDRKSAMSGVGTDGAQWTPMSEERVQPVFQIDGEIEYADKNWEFNYSLKLSIPEMQGPYLVTAPLEIVEEFFKVKEFGKPGAMKNIIFRRGDGKCTAKFEGKKRKEETFNVVSNMPALSVLKIREADEFSNNFPVASKFLYGVSDSRIVALNPQDLYRNNRSYSSRIEARPPGGSSSTISSINLYEGLKIIKEDSFRWDQLRYWSERLLRITNIDIREEPITSEDGEDVVNKILLLTQDSKILWPTELSNGSMVVIALLAIFLSPRLKERTLFIEEPEAYIHPKAIVDLVILMKEVVAEGSTVIASTHNPVVLNSLNANQVTLLSFDGGHMAHSHLIASIDTAKDALARGRINFGDLLQNDFK